MCSPRCARISTFVFLAITLCWDLILIASLILLNIVFITLVPILTIHYYLGFCGIVKRSHKMLISFVIFCFFSDIIYVTLTPVAKVTLFKMAYSQFGRSSFVRGLDKVEETTEEISEVQNQMNWALKSYENRKPWFLRYFSIYTLRFISNCLTFIVAIVFIKWLLGKELI